MKKNPECRHCHREIGRDEPLHQHLDGKFACEEHRYYAVIMEIESAKKIKAPQEQEIKNGK